MSENRTKMADGRLLRHSFDIGITWIDLRTIFRPDTKWSQFWLGICHLTGRVYMWSPLDFKKPTMITNLEVSPDENYCEAATECIYFDCPLNRFSKDVFLSKFNDIGSESLGLPLDFGAKPLWFNEEDSKYWDFWTKVLQAGQMFPEGGRLEFSEEKWKEGE